MSSIVLKQDTELIWVWTQDCVGSWSPAYRLRVYDDGEGPLWICGDECGVRWLIRARSFEKAWEIWVDESETIPESEIPEAYGFDGWDSDGEKSETEYSPETAEERFKAAVKKAEAGKRDYPELVEGYEYQSNSSGTGIVSVSHYVWLRELVREDLGCFHLHIRIARISWRT